MVSKATDEIGDAKGEVCFVASIRVGRAGDRNDIGALGNPTIECRTDFRIGCKLLSSEHFKTRSDGQKLVRAKGVL